LSGARGTLCPVCVRRAPGGACATHGRWQRHQLLTVGDRRRSAREEWQPYEPAPHACPRCLGDVAEVGGRLVCLDHDHGTSRHGPYEVDELLGPSAQRESALARSRLARRRKAQANTFTGLHLDLPDPARTARVLGGVAVLAGTVAYLVR
jgi:hypothetical protein